jgi:hypothetical protein
MFSSSKMKLGFGRIRQYEPSKRPKAPTTRQSVILLQRHCDVTIAGTPQLSKRIFDKKCFVSSAENQLSLVILLPLSLPACEVDTDKQ